MKLTRQLHDILLLPTGDQRQPLRQFVSLWCENHSRGIKALYGITYSNWVSKLPKNELLLLADLIAYYENKYGDALDLTLNEVVKIFDLDDRNFETLRDTFLNGFYVTQPRVPHGEVAEADDNDKPLLEGVTATDLFRMFVDIANETGCKGNALIATAVSKACRIHSSFEPVFNSARETWMDHTISDDEVDDWSVDAFDKLRDCHNASCAYITGENKPADSDAIEVPCGEKAKVINTIMSSYGLPDIEKMVSTLNSSGSKIKELEKRLKDSALTSHAEPIKAEMSQGSDQVNGKTVKKRACDVFNMPEKDFNFNIECWEWDAPNRNVPEIDPDYIFRPEELRAFLFAVQTNQRAMFWGDTGTGKTTLIEQGCARMNYMFSRINFEGEIGRFDLIGRDTLISDGENTVSKFIDGALPQAMALPMVLCCDEIDFVTPSVAYVMQAPLEGKPLVITEDGNRIVKPHPMFRIFGTGNTQGQGDEKSMYAGARPQSMAFLNRFTVWKKVDYLSADQRKVLLKKKCPTLNNKYVSMITQYVTEHLKAFEQGNVLQPITPRDMLSLGKAISTFTIMDSSEENAVTNAFKSSVLDRATTQDFAVLNGIVARVRS